MKLFFFLLALLFSCQIYSYDKRGYYININNERIEGFFEADKTYTNFGDFFSLKFKNTKSGIYQKLLIENVKEYGIGDEFKFVKYAVEVDESFNQPINSERNPKLILRELFLNVLVEAETTLYSYTTDYGEIFFFTSKNTSVIKQLIYKQYITSTGAKAENAMFKQQLYNNVNCMGGDENLFKSFTYSREELVSLFLKHNKCEESDYKVYINDPAEKAGVAFTVFAGVYLLNFKIGNTDGDMSNKYGIDYGGGIEAAYVVKSQKVELFVRLEYELLSAENKEVIDNGINILTNTYKLDATAVNLFMGSRYNLILNPSHKFFVDGAFVLSFPSGTIEKDGFYTTNSGSQYSVERKGFDLRPGFCGSFGIGYVINNKFGISARAETRRDFFDDVKTLYTTQISRMGMSIRYTF